VTFYFDLKYWKISNWINKKDKINWLRSRKLKQGSEIRYFIWDFQSSDNMVMLIIVIVMLECRLRVLARIFGSQNGLMISDKWHPRYWSNTHEAWCLWCFRICPKVSIKCIFNISFSYNWLSLTAVLVLIPHMVWPEDLWSQHALCTIVCLKEF